MTTFYGVERAIIIETSNFRYHEIMFSLMPSLHTLFDFYATQNLRKFSNDWQTIQAVGDAWKLYELLKMKMY